MAGSAGAGRRVVVVSAGGATVSTADRLVMALLGCREAGITSVPLTASECVRMAQTVDRCIEDGLLSKTLAPRASAYAALGQALRDVEAEL